MKAIELKEGLILDINGESYMILEAVGSGDCCSVDIDYIGIDVKRVLCDKCGGNLEKLGRIKNQYKCVECLKPVYLE